MVTYFDEYVAVKSRQALEKYDDVKFLKKIKENLREQRRLLKRKIT